jgi:hypothetical protein
MRADPTGACGKRGADQRGLSRTADAAPEADRKVMAETTAVRTAARTTRTPTVGVGRRAARTDRGDHRAVPAVGQRGGVQMAAALTAAGLTGSGQIVSDQTVGVVLLTPRPVRNVGRRRKRGTRHRASSSQSAAS